MSEMSGTRGMGGIPEMTGRLVFPGMPGMQGMIGISGINGTQ